MRVPLSLTASMAGYLTRKSITGAQKFPLVMMLEPLHACNLTCTGCGRIREYKSTINEMLTVGQCLKAVDDCGAPIVSICGGEPMIYPEIGRLTNEILARKKHIYLCTNGMFIRKHLRDFTPTSRLFFNVHLDGLEKTHDICVERDGVFREAIEGIKAAKAAGFLVTSNTTIYKETDIEEIADLFAYLQTLGVDGHMLSPAYSYAAVMTKEIFMSRDEIREKFRQAYKLLERYNIVTSPIYMEYLRGERELMCTAWGNPTYNPRGWKGPCYLMTDAHHESISKTSSSRRPGKSTAAGAILAAKIAWFTRVMRRPQFLAATRNSATPGRCSAGQFPERWAVFLASQPNARKKLTAMAMAIRMATETAPATFRSE